MTDTLAPCPFCGGQPKIHIETLDERYAYANLVNVKCASCGVTVSAVGDTSKPGYADNSTTEKRAVEAWNRRASPAAAVPEGAWHEAALAECMKIEAAYHPTDPARTLKELIDWHVQEASGVAQGVKIMADNYVRLTCATSTVPEGALPPLPKPWQDRGNADDWKRPHNVYQTAEIAEWRARAAVEADRARQQDMSVHLAGAPARLVGGPGAAEDQEFYRFWYSHMQGDVMTGALAGISHSTARYVWDAATRCRAEGGDGAPEAGDVSADRAQQGEPQALQTARNALTLLARNLVPHNPRAVAAGALEAIDAALSRTATNAEAPADAPFGYYIVEGDALPYPGAGFVRTLTEGRGYRSVTPLYDRAATKAAAPDDAPALEALYVLRDYAEDHNNAELHNIVTAAIRACHTAPAPNTGIPAAGEVPLFDSSAVYAEITRHLGKSHCHSVTTVQATLAALFRLMQSGRAPVSTTPTSGEVEKAEWISVDDARKPEEQKPVLLFVRTLTRGEDDDGRPYEVEGDQVEMGEYRFNNGSPYFQCFVSPMSDSDWVTHWMPLPVGPSEAKAGEDA